MSTPSKSAFLMAAALLLAAGAVVLAAPKAPPVRVAEISNSGSTNTTGYHLQIWSTGGVRADGKKAFLSKALTARFFSDLDAAMPLTALPVHHGMRSASFGTSTSVTYKEQRSPDLTFARDPQSASLKADIDDILKALHIASVSRRPILLRPLTPQPETH